MKGSIAIQEVKEIKVSVTDAVLANDGSVYQMGKIVFVFVALSLVEAPSTWANITVLKGLPKPAMSSIVSVVSGNQNGASVSVAVNNVGELIIRSQGVSPGTEYLRGQVVYIAS